VDVQRPKVAAKLLLLLDADVLEVLVAEHDHATLGDEKRELVLLLVVELGKLEAADLGANDGRQFGHVEVRVVLGKEVWLLLLRHQSPVVKLERLESGEMGLLVVDGKIRRVFVLQGSDKSQKNAGARVRRPTCSWASLSYAKVSLRGSVSVSVVIVDVAMVLSSRVCNVCLADTAWLLTVR
jgi:hypothetical protein